MSVTTSIAFLKFTLFFPDMTCHVTVAMAVAFILPLTCGDFSDFNLVDEFFARPELKDAFYKAKENYHKKSESFSKPKGLKTWNVGENSLERTTRDVEEDPDYKNKLKVAAQIEADVEKRLGQPLELIPFDLENENDTIVNGTEETPPEIITTTETPASLNFTDSSNDVIVLNDFIRFRRETEENGEDEDRDKREDEVEVRSEKLVDAGREPRGAVTEQWVKQPYSVQEDNVPASSDGFRAPRVHFVTHRMSESAQSPPAFYRSFDHEPRMSDFPRDMDRDFSYRTRYYEHPQQYRYRPDPYYHHDDVRDRRYYGPRYDRYGPDRSDHYSYSNRQQRRIIYYATLPEVVRTPERFSYYDRYDDRYPSPSETYKFRKQPSFTVTKSRYEQEMEGTKTPYPLKVSTDVNVREVKKNPERRIYSETERRYTYKAPAFQDEGNNFNGGNQ